MTRPASRPALHPAPRPLPRRAVLAATAGAAAALALPPTTARAATRAASGRATPPDDAPVQYHAWTSAADWRSGTARGTRVTGGRRPGVAVARPVGTTDYTDPHTRTTSRWEYAVWTSPRHRLPFGATEAVASWNADTPAGSWIRVELRGEYADGRTTPWYEMGRWAFGDGDIRRTSVDHQGDGTSSISTDTLAIDKPASGARLRAYRLRATLYRRPGTRITPVVHRLGAMASAIPDRFTVPASTPGPYVGHELPVPRFSQDIHKGQYPEYDNGGEAWCSPTSSEMCLEYWGRVPSAADLAWVDPSYRDPQVDEAARRTYDWQYAGCGNWPFNAAYAAGRHDMEAVVTRLRSLGDVERLTAAGIPVITSQSFLATELDGAGYGTAGHLMCVIGFTPAGDVIANDPASPDDAAVRHVYRRRQFETIWLRTRRKDANGQVKSGSGGVCYIFFPANPAPGQHRVLRKYGLC